MTTSYEEERGRRKRAVRKLTLSATRGALRAVLAARVDDEEGYGPRPATRGECRGGERPCPYASCKYHLYLDVAKNGSLTLNFPDFEVDELPQTCALDVADAGGVSLVTIGDLMNLTRERVRQIEAQALGRLAVPSVRLLAGPA